MKKYSHPVSIVIFIFFIGCKSNIIPPATYGVGEEHPRSRLFLKKNNRFELIYYSIFEKTTGKWNIKNDTLILNSEYIMNNYPKKDSTVHMEKRIFLIKGNKLLHSDNKAFYLKRIK